MISATISILWLVDVLKIAVKSLVCQRSMAKKLFSAYVYLVSFA